MANKEGSCDFKPKSMLRRNTQYSEKDRESEKDHKSQLSEKVKAATHRNQEFDINALSFYYKGKKDTNKPNHSPKSYNAKQRVHFHGDHSDEAHSHHGFNSAKKQVFVAKKNTQDKSNSNKPCLETQH
jgi:hypothetical protein